MASEQVYDLLMENVEFIDISDLIEKLLDDHLDSKDGDEGEEGKDGRPAPLTEGEKAEIRDEFKEAVACGTAAIITAINSIEHN